MRCKTQEAYDSFKCPLNSPKNVLLRQHKSSRSEDIDMLQFNLQENLQLSEMNYSSVHEMSISSNRNSTQQSEIIRKQEEIIKKQEKQIQDLKYIIVNQQQLNKNSLESQLRYLHNFIQRVFSEVYVNKENIYDISQMHQKDYDLCIRNIQEQKIKLKEQNKFIQCMRELIVSCSPPNFFENHTPNLKQIWRFIKVMLNECIEVKKINSEYQLMIQQIQRILQVASPKQIIPYLLIYKPTKM